MTDRTIVTRENHDRMMKLPPDVEFLEDRRLLIFRPHGILDRKEIDKVVHVIAELELSLNKPFNRFWDATGLAANPEVIHYARLLAVLTQGSPIKVRLFEKREEVAKWLDVPLEIIAPKDVDQTD